jgi:hypothetical protein
MQTRKPPRLGNQGLEIEMIAYNLFGRVNKNGDIDVFEEDGSAATCIDANVYPVGSSLSARWKHPLGIVLTVEDAKKIGLPIDE